MFGNTKHLCLEQINSIEACSAISDNNLIFDMNFVLYHAVIFIIDKAHYYQSHYS